MDGEKPVNRSCDEVCGEYRLDLSGRPFSWNTSAESRRHCCRYQIVVRHSQPQPDWPRLLLHPSASCIVVAAVDLASPGPLDVRSFHRHQTGEWEQIVDTREHDECRSEHIGRASWRCSTSSPCHVNLKS